VKSVIVKRAGIKGFCIKLKTDFPAGNGPVQAKDYVIKIPITCFWKIREKLIFFFPEAKSRFFRNRCGKNRFIRFCNNTSLNWGFSLNWNVTIQALFRSFASNRFLNIFIYLNSPFCSRIQPFEKYVPNNSTISTEKKEQPGIEDGKAFPDDREKYTFDPAWRDWNGLTFLR